jgi:hypothetical protein
MGKTANGQNPPIATVNQTAVALASGQTIGNSGAHFCTFLGVTLNFGSSKIQWVKSY